MPASVQVTAACGQWTLRKALCAAALPDKAEPHQQRLGHMHRVTLLFLFKTDAHLVYIAKISRQRTVLLRHDAPR